MCLSALRRWGRMQKTGRGAKLSVKLPDIVNMRCVLGLFLWDKVHQLYLEADYVGDRAELYLDGQ